MRQLLKVFSFSLLTFNVVESKAFLINHIIGLELPLFFSFACSNTKNSFQVSTRQEASSNSHNSLNFNFFHFPLIVFLPWPPRWNSKDDWSCNRSRAWIYSKRHKIVFFLFVEIFTFFLSTAPMGSDNEEACAIVTSSASVGHAK